MLKFSNVLFIATETIFHKMSLSDNTQCYFLNILCFVAAVWDWGNVTPDKEALWNCYKFQQSFWIWDLVTNKFLRLFQCQFQKKKERNWNSQQKFTTFTICSLCKNFDRLNIVVAHFKNTLKFFWNLGLNHLIRYPYKTPFKERLFSDKVPL